MHRLITGLNTLSQTPWPKLSGKTGVCVCSSTNKSGHCYSLCYVRQSGHQVHIADFKYTYISKYTQRQGVRCGGCLTIRLKYLHSRGLPA